MENSQTLIAQCCHCAGNFGPEYVGTYTARCSGNGHHFKRGNYQFVVAPPEESVGAEIIYLHPETVVAVPDAPSAPERAPKRKRAR